jgi:putative ABC transport system permease protein
MRISDYIEQACANLWKKKLRTILTTLGVVIGIGALVCMFAFGQGVQRNITDQFNKVDILNDIVVSAPRQSGGPRFRGRDDPGGPRRGGRRAAQAEANDPNVPPLDARFLVEARTIPGVETVFPELRFPAQLRLGAKEQFTLVQVLSADICRSGQMPLRAGRCYDANDPKGMVISDSMVRRLALGEPADALGKEIDVITLTLDFGVRNLLRMAFPTEGGQGLPIARESYRFTIVGVAERMPFGGMSDAYVQPEVAAGMRKLSFTNIWDLYRPTGEGANYSSVTVKVRSPADIASVKKELESRGYNTFTLMDQLDEMRIAFLIMDMFLLAVGMIGITVASLGIVNTMVMSILERYREIGIMKAVGATDGDVQRIFLFESGAIGLLGGTFGLALAAAVSFVINEVINAIMARQHAPRMVYFDFPWWLCLGAIFFSILVSLLAGLYPTRRAARVDPIVALRHD